jgi:hypothetical protein
MQNIGTRYIMPIILLISLMFSNTASAGLFGIDGFLSDSDARCRLEYTQLDLRTGVQKIAVMTTQFDDRGNQEICEKCATNMANKMSNWVEDSNSHIIVNLTKMSYKRRENSFVLWHTWDDYKLCNRTSVTEPFRYSDIIVRSLRDHNKIGYNVNRSRILEDL